MINNLSTLLSLQISSIWGIKNERFEVVKTPPNSFPSFFKKLQNKVIKLPSLFTLLPSFFKLPNNPLELRHLLSELNYNSSSLIPLS